MPIARHLPLALAAASAMLVVAPARADDVARVTNIATLSLGAPDARVQVRSNAVALDVDRTKRPTTLGFRLLPPGYALSGERCDTTPAPRYTPAPIDADTLSRAAPVATLDGRTPVIVVLDNAGGNRDPAVRESATIHIDTDGYDGPVTLLETGPDTGVFAGGISLGGGDPAAVACDVSLERGGRMRLSFTEDQYSFGSVAELLIDPAGEIFDSATGAPVEGATVTLLDDADRPATVFGDDGISRYPATVTSGGTVRDSSGRTYILPPGRYRFPLVAPGRYHLRVEPPAGYTAPSTRSRGDLAQLRDPTGRPFILNDASFGAGFTLSKPDPFYADVPVDRAGPTTLLLTKTASVREASPGDIVRYRVTLANRTAIDARDVRVTDLLPPGLRYQPGSTRGADEPRVAADGRTLSFVIPLLRARATIDLRYVVTVTPGAPPGEAVNRVLASGSAGATGNEAAASVRLRPLLFSDGFTVIGRVTEGACGDPARRRTGVAGVRILLEDGTFVVTDRDGLYHLEGIRPGRHVVQLDRHSIPATHRAVACDADTRAAGDALSRFVDSDGGLLKRVDFQLAPTGRTPDAAAALPIAVAPDAIAAGNRDWFDGQAPGVAMLFPLADHNPRAPAVRVVVKHLPEQRVALIVNGVQSDPLAFDGTEARATGVAISRWSGIALVDGDNRIEARVLAPDGAVVTVITRIVHSSGTPAHAVALPQASRLVADGITRPLVAVRLTDRAGRPVRAGTSVPVRVEAPYAPALDVALDQRRRATAATPASPAAAAPIARVVGDDGIAFIELQPTTQAGAVRATVTLADAQTTHDEPVRAWLAPGAAGWTVVGFGAGTIGHDILSRRGSALPADRAGTILDGQLALYAKGRIKGSWLATIAYDSKRTRDRTRGLLGTIDPDRYYTVYGDATRQGYDAATAGKLYLRLERREVVALLGDYETGLRDTQLGRYSRTLTGAKIAYEGDRVTVTAFAAHTDELYGRDEIQGNGLSGPYRLSARDIVPNTDRLRIEVRDRLRPELIVSSTPMTRHIDYDIDPLAGTIRFRQPVLGRDAARNPIFIVVDYETWGSGRKAVGGARAAVRVARGAVELGATALRDRTVGDAALLAVDARARLSADTQVRAEAATGGAQGLRGGGAWLAEVEHHGPALDLTAYARQQDAGFGLGQQNVVERGTRKIGLDGRLALTDRLALTGTAWHQQQLLDGASRVAGDARLEWRRAHGTLFAGAQVAQDRGLAAGQDRASRLLTLGGTQALAGDRITLEAQTQVAPDGAKASIDFPIRHQLTAGWRVRPGIRLIGGYEIAEGRGFTAQTAQVGFDVAPWTGAKWTSTLNRQAAMRPVGGENSQRTYAQYGLNQSLPIGRRWTVDATLDASSTLRGQLPVGAAINAFHPIAVGGSLAQDGANDDYAAVTLGAAYRADRWSWNGRAEYRTSDSNTRYGLTTNVLRALGEGRTLASALRGYAVRDRDGALALSLSADVALAWRPLDSDWSVLERLQLRHERADRGFTDRNVLGVPAFAGGDQATLRAINNLALHYRSGPEGEGHGWDATLYHGLKWVRGSFDADDYTGLTDAIGIDVRRDLGRRVDIGVQASVQHGWTSRTVAFSAGPTLGLSPARDVWITAGYNIAGYRDRDFTQDRYTRKGAFVTLRMKFDPDTLAGAGRMLGIGR